MWSAQGSKKIQSFNFVTISSEHYFCSSGVYTFGTILKDKASKRVLWLIVSGVGNNCMLLRHECDFAVCIVILSPISTAWESKSSIKKKKKTHSRPLFSNCSFIIYLAARWDRAFPICWWIFILGCLPQKHDDRWYMGWSRDTPWCGELLWNMYSRDQQSVAS